jgi:hypothetical protein
MAGSSIGVLLRASSAQSSDGMSVTHEGAHCQQMLEPGAKVHVRAVATGFAEE